ncbi:uncharacterized protein LOC111802239 isoform X1 [Cucurbita pepo subsp. pepo]|uniref:uncharacterized protein LOC111802239 isoform X1 n=1 Tax=Cucurbita pepo subsp. pepo TaxID=3664 RepID=UPI000C9D3432|nr:uncharacterized protein LOC111802239 isoform X1 [Cucurbita pepo subsp. pepo]
MTSKHGDEGNGERIVSEGSRGRDDGGEMGKKLTVSTLQGREEEIERRKMEVKEKVELQLSRAEEEAKRLAQIWEELEVMGDPMGKEVGNVRKRIDTAKKELKSLGQICQKKEKEYKEVLEIFNEKTNEKAQLLATLMELLDQSERWRMNKLEELSKHMALTN